MSLKTIYMRWNICVLSFALAALLSPVAPCVAATFGTVVPIGGHASDIALDESRGLLYIANFTANRIEVMSTANYAIRTSMNVAPQPGALAISPDNRFLLVAHYGNITPVDPSRNAITLINLGDNTRQTFSTGDTPLGLTFVADGRALIVTATGLMLFDPISGAMKVVDTFANLGKVLPAPLVTFPSQVILAELSTNADRTVAYGIADSGAAQVFFRYDLRRNEIYATGIVAAPKPLPRVSVAADGSWAMIGQYRVDGFAADLAQFPNSISSLNIGGNAVDSNAGIIYAQILATAGGPQTIPVVAGALPTTPVAPVTGPPVLSILDAENLLVRESFSIPENIIGRSVLSAASDVLYTVSDSGVMVFPVGRMNQQHRLTVSQSDVVARGTFCDRNVITQTLTITDPGGGNTDFQLLSNIAGVTISPSSGITPAKVQVRVDPSVFQNQNGTLTASLTLASATAVNLPPPVRVLINNRNPDQRGTFINIPGKLTDILADPVRNRFYVVAQDRNQVLVFDGTNYSQIAALKTSTTPTQMAFTFDRKYLVVGHDDSQFAYVWDLDTLQAQLPIVFPPGHYPRSIAESGKTMLALVRNVAKGGPGVIDRIDFAARRAIELPSLGIYTNSLDMGTVLSPAPNGGAILLAAPDGNVMLYDANADTFTVSRKDFAALSGSYAASSYNTYVVGNTLLNASLVPAGTLESASGAASGFAFIDQGGFRTTASAPSSPGVIQRFDAAQSGSTGKPTRLVEAPLVPAGLMKFIRTLAPMYDRSAVIALTVSGITVLPWNYDAAVAPPKIGSVVNAADGKLAVAPGGLISVYGQQMSPVNIATREIPLPTALGESCLTINGVPMPVLFVSPQQINGQLPFNVDGNATMTLRTPGGISDNFNFSILAAAASVFRSGTSGTDSGLATITRADNNELITPTNPIHPNDTIVIWATGLGRTNPPVETGMPSPSDPLPSAIIAPTVTLGGVALDIQYAGLVPGSVGLYQINAMIPGKVPQGLEIPLVINQGGISTALSVRVVK
jgi:uncharacterized protein (TIGR03437 family)